MPPALPGVGFRVSPLFPSNAAFLSGSGFDAAFFEISLGKVLMQHSFSPACLVIATLGSVVPQPGFILYRRCAGGGAPLLQPGRAEEGRAAGMQSTTRWVLWGERSPSAPSTPQPPCATMDGQHHAVPLQVLPNAAI